MPDRASRSRVKFKRLRNRVAHETDLPAIQESDIASLQAVDVSLDSRLDTEEAATASLDGRLDVLEADYRVKARRTATQSITDNTATFVDFSAADVFDEGAWHDHASGTLDVREKIVVPTGAGGYYAVTFNAEFANHTHQRTLLVELMVDTGGGYVAEAEVFRRMEFGDTVVDPTANVTWIVSLAAGNQLKVRITSADQAGADALTLNSASLTAVRVV